MQTGHYHFHHNAVYKRDTHADASQKGHIGNIVGYRARADACDKIIAVNAAPYPSRLTAACVDAYVNTKRKDGRVLDRINIAMPRDMSRDEMYETGKSMLYKLTQGKAVAFGMFHELDTHNPHLHVVLIDQDVETKKRVYGVTKLNSTNRMRKDWQEVCNDKLEQFGYDIRIDHRSNKDISRELEEKELANDNRPDGYSIEDVEEFDLGEPPRAEPSDIHTASVSEQVENLRHAQRDIKYISTALENTQTLRDILPMHERELIERKASLSASQSGLIVARQREAAERSNFHDNHTDGHGNKKGFKLGAFGYTLYESPTRRTANAAERTAIETIKATENEQKNFDLVKTIHDRIEAEYELTRAELTTYEDALSVYGTEEEAEQALRYTQEGADALFRDLAARAPEVMEALEKGEIEKEDWDAIQEAQEDLSRRQEAGDIGY